MPTTSKRRREVLDVPLPLDRAAGNQALQVHASLRAAILDGRLVAGLRLPSSRALADQLGVRRNAIVVAYEHLLSDGLAESRVGAGTYVAARLPVRQAAPRSEPVIVDTIRRGVLAIGQTHGDPILLQRLAGAVRRRIMAAGKAELGYGDPRGSEALRKQVALHLAASRGILCDPACILITTGTQQGLRLCIDALLKPGDAVWLEDPGYPTSRRTLVATGMRPVPVPVDAEGLDVVAGRALSETARGAYVTPSHQFPTGVTMSMTRRIALLDWARETGAWVFEDDYDSEFRYAGPPLTALAGLGGSDRVIYLGTFSKTLFPGLRLAYAVLPPAALEAAARARAFQDRFPSPFMADAVADLMADGVVAAHTRRMRSRYRAARDALAGALENAAGDALRLVAPTQGLHMLAYLPDGLPPDAAEQIRERAKVAAWLLSETRLAQKGPDGFILGFSGYEISELVAAAERLGQAAREYMDSRID